MDNIYRHLLRLALSALPLACVAMLSSCSFEDEVGDCGGESATVRISVSAGEIGDLNGTRVGGDENADEHEFMNTLSVYIVDGSNNIVHPFKDAIGSSNAGELTNWTSDPFELNPGVYTIYAFSNFEGHTGITDNIQNSHDAADFIAKCFDGNKIVNTTGLEQFRLEDPAKKINLTAPDGKAVFIPMSAKVEQVQVTPTTTMLSVGLVRLVSKVKLTMPSADINTDAASVTFSGYSTNVPLLGELYSGTGDYSYNTNTGYYGDRTASTTALLSSSTAEGNTVTASLYVNETPGNIPFTVTLNTGNATGVAAYTATTLRADIPRNTIYPLTLTFTESGITLTPNAYLQVNGVPAYDVSIMYDVTNQDTYTFGITYGSYLTIEPSVQNVQGTPIFTWTEAENNPDGMSTPEHVGGLPALGDGGILRDFSADSNIQDYEYKLSLNAKWTASDGTDYDRTYNIIIAISQDYDTVADGIIGRLTRSNVRNGRIVLSSEILNMVDVNN